MNIEYLNKIELGTEEKPGYILKSPELVKGYIDQYGRKYIKNVPSLLFPVQIDNYTYDDFLTDFESFLNQINHLSSEHIIISLIPYFLLLREKPGKTVKKAWHQFTNEFFCKGKLHMEFPMNLRYDLDDTLNLRDYDIGKFDFKTLKRKIKNNTQSDYWERFLAEHSLSENNIQNFFSIRRIENSIPVFDATIFFDNFPSKLDYIQYANDYYFQALAYEFFNKFWSDFEEQLYISLAYGGVYYNKEYFLKFGVGDGTQIAVFTHIGQKKSLPKNGWVIPTKSFLEEMHFDSRTPIPEINKRLAHFYKVTKEKDSEFFQLIEILIKFMANGSKLLFEDKLGEAFLNFWIGLDALLNDDNNKAQSNLLKNRIAALTCKHYNKMHKSQYFTIKELYDIRSAYVHAGQKVERKRVSEIHEICEIILDVLLNMHENNLNYEDLTLKGWYEDIDTLISKGQNKELPGNELLENTGIVKIKEE
jgi:hypothetical protein